MPALFMRLRSKVGHFWGLAMRKLAHLWHLILKEAAKFGVIGAIAFIIDNGTYAYLQYGWFGPQNGPLHGHIKISTVLATGVATLFAWVGSRYWTFRNKRTSNPTRELVQFGFFNVIGALITLACVMIAVDVLDLRGLGWESAARNTGIVLGTLFRFWAYRKFVFRTELAGELDVPQAGDAGSGSAEAVTAQGARGKRDPRNLDAQPTEPNHNEHPTPERTSNAPAAVEGVAANPVQMPRLDRNAAPAVAAQDQQQGTLSTTSPR